MGIAYALLMNLMHAGHVGFLTRATDHLISLTDRLDFNEKIVPDAFISIHCNASADASVRGTEVFYRHAHSLSLATYISEAVSKHMNTKNRGAKVDTISLGTSLTVLNAHDIPSVLVEAGFITNLIDLNALGSQDEVAGAIWSGIQRWILEEG